MKKAQLLFLIIGALFVHAVPSFGNIYTVINNNDSGVGSLRDAITSANTNAGLDSIYFNIPGGTQADRTIVATTVLPTITELVIIDGTTQPNGSAFGFSNAKIVLDGLSKSLAQGIKITSVPVSSRNTEIYGLYITRFIQAINITGDAYDRCVIGSAGKGNVISNNRDYGVYVSGADTIKISGNLIGVNSNGDTIESNATGIYLLSNADACTIGGSLTEKNIISGNTSYGIRSDVSFLTIKGNYIGTNALGTLSIPNGTGIYLSGGANALIGGNTADEKNLVSGNGSYGIRIDGTNTKIIGNYIGTNAFGTAAISNGNGIYNGSGGNHQIGGNSAGERNIVSGNGTYGIRLSTNNNSITGNYVGTDVSGTLAIPNGTGIYVSGGTGNVVGGNTSSKRNIISGNNNYGVQDATTGTLVIGNYIGTDVTGAKALGNSTGVYGSSATNLEVGGTNAGQGNLISGNRSIGIYAGAATLIKGNLIGTNAAGTDTLGNGSYGIQVNGTNTLIGGSTVNERNIISGNYSSGIFTQVTNTTVKGNYIGLDITGTKALGNTQHGIYCNKSFLTVGGSATGEGNIISGNGSHGVYIINSGSSQAVIKGNLIGVDATGTNKLANTGKGIFLSNADRATIGGTTSGERNVIAYNGEEGVYISGSPAIRNKVSGNSIFCNSQNTGTGGIALITNANGNKAAPLIDTATTQYIRGTAAANNTIELFYNGTCTYCEGKTFITSLLSDTAGKWTYTGTILPNNSISATAIDSVGNTSKFSTCKNVFQLNDLPVANPDLASGFENTPLAINVLANDNFGNDGPSSSAITITSNPTHGVATVNNNATPSNPTDDQINYTGTATFFGLDSLVYQICDSNNDCDTAVVVITVQDVNDLPVANPDVISLNQNSSVNIPVLSNDNFGTDGPSANPITISSNAQHGTAVVNDSGTPSDPADDDITYTPNNGYAGNDVFIYQVCDANGDCDTALVSITVLVTGVEETNREVQFHLYPNPISSNILHLVVPRDWIGKEFEIFELTGRKVAEGIIRQEKSTADITHLSSGTFFLKISDKTLLFIK